jgi:hypothetical protein
MGRLEKKSFGSPPNWVCSKTTVLLWQNYRSSPHTEPSPVRVRSFLEQTSRRATRLTLYPDLSGTAARLDVTEPTGGANGLNV